MAEKLKWGRDRLREMEWGRDRLREMGQGQAAGSRSGRLWGQGSAGPCLRSQEGSGKVWVFALRARGGFVRLQCSLRHGPAAAGCALGTGYPLETGDRQ
jgi:hypothetical protein